MKHYKLTTANYLAAGKAIMSDARCTDAVKSLVRQGTSGEMDADGFRTYIVTGKEEAWFDKIIIGLAE